MICPACGEALFYDGREWLHTVEPCGQPCRSVDKRGRPCILRGHGGPHQFDDTFRE